MDQQGGHNPKPTLYCGNLAKLPAALKPLCARPQWVIWRLTWDGRRWTKAPYRCDDPDRHASSNNPNTWSTYEVAVAAAAHGNGISYVLTPEDPFAAADIDHVRDPVTGTIEGWAQRLLDQASRSYAEISPSGTGLRIWGMADGQALHKHFTFDGNGLELFRRASKILTVTGLRLGASQTLGNIDALIDRALAWGRQRQHKISKTKPGGRILNAGTMAQYSIDELERIVQEGAPEGANRSDTFHGIVGHYLGCGWTVEQITEHLEQFPDGIGNRYIAEGRLSGEVRRSAAAFATKDEQQEGAPWSSGWQPEPTLEEPAPAELAPTEPSSAETEPEEAEPEEAEPEDDGLELPTLYCHGDPDPRPVKDWTIKGLMMVQGHGLLSGQWGTYKTFVAFELAGSLMTGEPFLGHMIKRQCGVLFLAAEGQYEVRLRLEAMVREKCGGMARAPFRWFEDVPVLLQPDGLELLVAMGKKAAASLQKEFGLPLGLIIIDTVAASAGYTGLGAENDTSINQRLMTVLKLAGQKLDCFVLGVDNFGKDVVAGTRGASAKESSSDLVLSLLGDRELSGRVLNTRLVIRKCRGGRSGEDYPFSVREVELPEPDEDGDPITTLVIQWGAHEPQPIKTTRDPWEESRQAETRQAMLLLKRIMMAKLAEAGRELPLSPPVRGINREILRTEFYAQTPADGTEEQKQAARRKRFNRAIDRAREKQLIGIREIDGVTYLWLQVQQPDEENF